MNSGSTFISGAGDNAGFPVGRHIIKVSFQQTGTIMGTIIIAET